MKVTSYGGSCQARWRKSSWVSVLAKTQNGSSPEELKILLNLQIASNDTIEPHLHGKSSIASEYEARFQQLLANGDNCTHGSIAGSHQIQKETDEPWEGFATKCAEVIKGLVYALTSAVSSQPGDATQLQLDIKNHIFHHDNRKFNTCKPASFLPDEESKSYSPRKLVPRKSDTLDDLLGMTPLTFVPVVENEPIYTDASPECQREDSPGEWSVL